jgi:hypothetical protein
MAMGFARNVERREQSAAIRVVPSGAPDETSHLVDLRV